jgi:hypothetical protein
MKEDSSRSTLGFLWRPFERRRCIVWWCFSRSELNAGSGIVEVRDRHEARYLRGRLRTPVLRKNRNSRFDASSGGSPLMRVMASLNDAHRLRRPDRCSERIAAPVGTRIRSARSLKAENLFLHRQLTLYVERGVKPRRIDAASRILLAIPSRLFNWRDALVVVRPETMIRWHRAGWRLFWRLKSRPGRPPIPQQLQALIRRMANENPSWGEERIAKSSARFDASAWIG